MSRQHCKLTIDENGGMILSNLKSGVDTYVNGLQIESKRISMNDRVELGQDRYMLNLDVIKKIVDAANPSSYFIRHLEEVWEKNHEEKLKIQIKLRKEGAIRTITGTFSVLAIVCSMVFPNVPYVREILFSLGASFGVYWGILNFITAPKLPKYLDELDRKFHEDYVCPNPRCQHFIGYQPYRDLERSHKCPYCGAKFVAN